MSGNPLQNIFGGILMCGNNNGICGCFGGNNLCWIIILILLFCNCGGNFGGSNYQGNCGCDNNCGCC